MKKKVFLIILFPVFISCEKENNDIDEMINPPLKITVYDASQWSPENPEPECSGATIVLKRNSNEYTQITAANGVATFDDLIRGSYRIDVSKDGKYNMSEYDSDTEMGYKILGIFQTQEEIDSYVGYGSTPLQPNAQPGDLKLQDTNADGIISEDDKVVGVSINYETRVDINRDEIISADDKVDGKFQYVDVVEATVIIGY